MNSAQQGRGTSTQTRIHTNTHTHTHLSCCHLVRPKRPKLCLEYPCCCCCCLLMFFFFWFVFVAWISNENEKDRPRQTRHDTSNRFAISGCLGIGIFIEDGTKHYYFSVKLEHRLLSSWWVSAPFRRRKRTTTTATTDFGRTVLLYLIV